MDTQPITTEAETNEAFRVALQKGVDSAAAGHLVSYAEVRQWLASWGTEHELPAPHRK